MHRWLRVLICLLLVSCILVNLSPLKAEATAGTVATAVTLAVGIPVAVAFGLNALGVRQGSSPSAFNQVVSDCVDALSPNWAVNGLTTMLALTTDGVTRTFVNLNFLQALLDLLHADLNILSSPSNSLQVTDFLTKQSGTLSAQYPFSIYTFYNSARYSNYQIILSDHQQTYTFTNSSGNSSNWSGNFGCNGVYFYCASVSSNLTPSFPSLPDINYNTGDTLELGVYIINTYFPSGYNSSVTTSEDLTLESVGHDIETDYETYVETGIVGIDFGVQFEDDPNTNRNEEDDGNDLWLPVGIPGQLSGGSYIDQTQQDAQSGNTPQDVLDSLLQNSGSGDGTGDSTGEGSGTNTGTWKPPSDHNVFALADLSKFFPFCIPFDLYDFFTLLNAEPVAPVLSWEIKDLAGQTYSLDVDLSQWDSVALLFRRLQLFLFITGLAAASRKFIKW